MIVRPATPDDALTLATVEVITWQVAYLNLLPDGFLQALSITHKAEEWRANLLKHGDSGQRRVLLALDQQDTVGFVRVGTMQGHESVGLLYLLYVLPAYWKQGVGSTLLQAGMRELLDLGHDTAILWVLRNNIRARQFYERRGWQPDGQTTTVEYGGSSLEALSYKRKVQPLSRTA